LPLVAPKPRGAWRETIEKNVRGGWEEVTVRAHLKADPLNPELFFWELSERVPDNSIFAVDTGMSTTFFSRAVKARRDMKLAISGTLATMGPAVSFACAAKFAFPDRPAFAFVGDGAIAVLNNRDLNMVTWDLRALGGSPKVAETQDIPDLDYATYAEMLGLRGLRLDRPEEIGPVWDEALAADRPVVIDVRADPNVIALPPHATLEQTKNFFLAMARGDSERDKVLTQLYRQLAA
jgi:pyruvate dehydrogenase (quinone)